MNKLQVDFCGKKLKNPVVMASGTFGFGKEYGEIYDISKLGGISGKGLTINPKAGNDGIRVWETKAGIINSVGLENPGVDAFLKNDWDFMKKSGTQPIINVGGSSIETYKEACIKLNNAGVDFIELNISCPNVKEGGMAFGIIPKMAYEIVSQIRPLVDGILMVKLSPNATNIVEVAKACEDAGADAVSLVNTFKALAIDIKSKKAVFNNIYAGLSGPCIMPIALRMVHEVSKAIKIPVMGMGGICTWEDAIMFLMAGAKAVQIGTLNFTDTKAGLKIIKGLEDYVEKENLNHISDIIGII